LRVFVFVAFDISHRFQHDRTVRCMVGGSWGYAEFLASITKLNDPEHHNMLDWYGDDVDSAFFDHTRVNYRLYGMKV
ncbi:plasmid pRiA4b ORF-3 family protein, partial [Pseudomonas syringae group genomosp. 3]